MIVLSCLGTAAYTPLNYVYNSKSFNTSFCVKAIKEYYNTDDVYILMTKKAKEKNYENLKAEIQNFKEIPILDGKNENEIWKIFEIIYKSIPENSKLVLDVTYGFRSLPMIMLSSAVYLKLLKNVCISDIVYGAFEAKDENNNTPVFSLTPFLDIINWTTASDYFIKRNDSAYLKSILQNTHNETYIRKKEVKSTGLSRLGDTLKNISDSFSVLRPDEICSNIRKLKQNIDNVKSDLENISETKPLLALLEKINDTYSKFIMPENDLFSENGLRIQKEIINIYLKTNHYQQAITLAREFILSIFCLKENLNPANLDDRIKIEKLLGNDIEILKNDKLRNDENKYHYTKNIAELWSRITTVRNDIDHAGMKKQHFPTLTVISEIEQLCQKIISEF